MIWICQKSIFDVFDASHTFPWIYFWVTLVLNRWSFHSFIGTSGICIYVIINIHNRCIRNSNNFMKTWSCNKSTVVSPKFSSFVFIPGGLSCQWEGAHAVLLGEKQIIGVKKDKVQKGQQKVRREHRAKVSGLPENLMALQWVPSPVQRIVGQKYNRPSDEFTFERSSFYQKTTKKSFRKKGKTCDDPDNSFLHWKCFCVWQGACFE